MRSTWVMFCCRGNIEQPAMFFYFYFHNKTNLSDFKKRLRKLTPSHTHTHAQSLTLSLSTKNQCFFYISAILPWGIYLFCFLFLLLTTWRISVCVSNIHSNVLNSLLYTFVFFKCRWLSRPLWPIVTLIITLKLTICFNNNAELIINYLVWQHKFKI